MRWSHKAHEFDPVLDGEVFLTTTLLASGAFHNGDFADAKAGFERDRIWAASIGLPPDRAQRRGVPRGDPRQGGRRRRCAGVARRVRAIYARPNLRRHSSRGPAELAKALVAVVDDQAEAVARLRFAADLMTGSPDRLLAITVLQALADLEQATGHDSDAARHEATAADLLSTCRDPGSVLRARKPAVRTTRRPRRNTKSELTERQIDVLRLVAQGLSNAEVAAALDVSERTVHAHLRALFDRIGARNRTAAVRYARRPRPPVTRAAGRTA